MTNQELLAKREKLNSYLGQLIDLQFGVKNELVITKGEHADLIAEVLAEVIKQIDEELRKEANE